MPTTWEIFDDVVFFASVTLPPSVVVPSDSITDASIAADAAIARSKLATDTLQPVDMDLAGWRDADTLLPLAATSTSPDLGFYPGTYGTNAPLIRSPDAKAAGAVSFSMRRQVALRPEYVAASAVRVRLFVGMVTTIADVSCTIDVEVREITGAGVGSDICQTAAVTMNSTTFANKDFVLDAAALAPGDSLDIRVTIACNDGATATAVIAAIAKTQLLQGLRG